MKADVTNINSRSQRHTERLNGTIEVFVIQGVLIVPDSSIGASYLITHKPDAVVAWIGLDLVYCRATQRLPGLDGRVHSLRRCRRAKRETRGAADGKLTIGHIVIHVALAGMRLAPGVFMRSDILGFGEVRRALIKVLV